MTISNEAIKDRGETFGNEVYSMMSRDQRFKNLTWPEMVLSLDHMYAQMFANIYKDVFRKEYKTK